MVKSMDIEKCNGKNGIDIYKRITIFMKLYIMREDGKI